MHLLTGILMLMEPRHEGSLTSSISGDDSSSETGLHCDRKCKRREKNRVSARKSRKKQTERADVLHQELQSLEHSNAAYEKEIAKLRLEIERYTSALKQHEPHCAVFSHAGTETSPGAPSPVRAPSPVPLLGPAAAPSTELSLPDLLNCADWPQFWDSAW